MKNIVSFFLCFFVCLDVFAAVPFTGFYQTIDDETNKPKSIVALYEYKDSGDSLLAGRIIALYDANGGLSDTLNNPIKTADKVEGKPKYVGLDIVWDMEWDAEDKEFFGGKIMDPKNGKVYSSVIWQEDESELKVRGKIGPFGRTQVWKVLNISDLPVDLQSLNINAWTPVVRK